MKKIILALILCFIFLANVTHSDVRADSIKPDQVLIIANSKLSDSIRLANLYAQGRQIPSRNIIALPLPTKEDITRDQYNTLLAGPVREFLTRMKLENKIKILVTMYGVPLRVGAATATAIDREYADEIKQKYYAVFGELEKRYSDLVLLAKMPLTTPSTLPGRQEIDQFSTSLPAIAQKIDQTYKQIVSAIRQAKDPIDQNRLANQFTAIRLDIEGQGAFVQAVMANNPTQGNLLQAELKKKEQVFYPLLMMPVSLRSNSRVYEQAHEIGGLVLELKTLKEDYDRLMQKDSASAVDSELSLLLWRPYPLAGRLPNALNPRFKDNPLIADQKPTLMVSRLDGPSAETVQRLIRESLAVEKQGLNGKVYIDARGINKKGDGFFVYDDDLRDLADEIKSKTSFPVILDNKSELFPPKSCPDAGLYCGWYSLRKYIPAFTFIPGSVGYHIASFEATTLKSPQTNEWVRQMLDNGIAATLGAVDEPYLDAFPLPSEFFGLLMIGKDTLVEVFYKTSRYNSWRIILIGDPLYRPFSQNASLDEKDVALSPLSLLLLN
jgi:uncharacterized protein (TIGR03790 family)